MDTNNSSIVSKRSVEKLYYPNQPEYFRYFVRKFQRRSPLINRGYWLRMKAIEKSVSRFLSENNNKTKLVVNLGCGYDPLPFQFLGIYPEQCKDAIFVDVDYPQLMQRKVDVIKSNRPLLDLLPGFEVIDPPEALLASSQCYKALGCNLNDISSLNKALRQTFDLDSSSIAIIFVAEVSVAYMERHAADAVLRWAANLNDARFCLLEQHLPDGVDHPFAYTMLRHFEKLRTPLHAIGTIDQMRSRFTDAGWSTKLVSIQSLWDLWSDPAFLSGEERQSLDQVEPFDEWEEFALFGSHYFLLDARTSQASFGNESELPKVDSLNIHETRSKWVSKTIGTATNRRRFAASAANAAQSKDQMRLWHYGGLGTQERLKTADVYCHNHSAHNTRITDLPIPLMCHTMTNIRNTSSETLLVGGRTSPDKPSAACWLFDGQNWKEVEAIPNARYRHCAVSVTIGSSLSGVLVYGGKTSSSKILGDCWFFDPLHGWREVNIQSADTLQPRFGAAMAAEVSTNCSGLLVGGMRADGTIIDECLSWQVGKEGNSLKITFSASTTLNAAIAKRCVLSRFGAQLVSTPHGMILMGGVAGVKMLTRDNELVNLSTGEALFLQHQMRPLVVGFSAQYLDSGVIAFLGGGATCFSFGTFWNQSCVLIEEDSDDSFSKWQALTTVSQSHGRSDAVNDNVKSSSRIPTFDHTDGQRHITVPRMRLQTQKDFQEVFRCGEPVILEDLDIGDCTSKWTVSYLRDKIGPERSVVVHNSAGPNMDFQTKNFTYQSMLFDEFFRMIDDGSPVYLRALSSERPADSPTDLDKDFPTIAQDFQLPPQLAYVGQHAHSSPLRISGSVNMWLHYDVMANVLCQIRGSKRLRLYAPECATQMGFLPGASSSSMDVWDESTAENLRSRGIQGFEAHLNEGDVLFIPSLWLHTAQPTTGLSVAVNVFFRDERMEAAYAAGKDVYGNRDVAAYERGRRDVQRIARSFEGLPPRVQKFYLSRLAHELESRIN
ncbi:LCM-domain-containing protein [Myriangium duriaei CBS 260.36]|uniref:tRNA wybutosine-synthesizing protein 4 n=1 Tax=Myriangium duriaei CBS 260.36 TaxID=1168546 RepID=A0A9P4IZ42_9PEZI|nr:LCM-domain-containing protein [Myriangium duriaei CBS 260.36]